MMFGDIADNGWVDLCKLMGTWYLYICFDNIIISKLYIASDDIALPFVFLFSFYFLFFPGPSKHLIK